MRDEIDQHVASLQAFERRSGAGTVKHILTAFTPRAVEQHPEWAHIDAGALARALITAQMVFRAGGYLPRNDIGKRAGADEALHQFVQDPDRWIAQNISAQLPVYPDPNAKTAAQYLSIGPADVHSRYVGRGSIDQICSDFSKWGAACGMSDYVAKPRIAGIRLFERAAGEGTVERILFHVAPQQVAEDPKVIEHPDAPVRISLVAMQLMVWAQGDVTREPIRSSPRANIETVALNFSSDPHQWVQAEIKIGSRPSYPLVGRVGRGTGQQIAGHFRTWAFSATDLTDASVGAYVNAMEEFDKQFPGGVDSVLNTVVPAQLTNDARVREFTSRPDTKQAHRVQIGNALRLAQLMVHAGGRVPRPGIGTSVPPEFLQNPAQWVAGRTFQRKLPDYDLSEPTAQPTGAAEASASASGSGV